MSNFLAKFYLHTSLVLLGLIGLSQNTSFAQENPSIARHLGKLHIPKAITDWKDNKDSYSKECLDTLNMNLTENGNKLSGGQLQRLAIARALYKDPQILIFDEATSALDATTEKKILDSIKNMSKDKTMLMVTHKNEIKPFIKRRMKKDVAKELPDLIEQEVLLDLSPQQKTEYTQIYENRENYDSMFEVLNDLKQVSPGKKLLLEVIPLFNIFFPSLCISTDAAAVEVNIVSDPHASSSIISLGIFLSK